MKLGVIKRELMTKNLIVKFLLTSNNFFNLILATSLVNQLKKLSILMELVSQVILTKRILMSKRISFQILNRSVMTIEILLGH